MTDEDLLASLDLDTPGMEKVKAAAATGDMTAVKAAYLDYRRTACPVRWHYQPLYGTWLTDPPVLPTSAPKEAAATDDPAADEILAHHLYDSIYGGEHKIIDMGKDFNWTYNPRAPSDPAFSTEFTHNVGRMDYWRILATAYWKTLDEKYAAGWVSQMEDFVSKNPPPVVPPADPLHPYEENLLWRTLEVAIRMNNSWPNAYFHFLNSPSFTPDAQWIYLRSVYDHAVVLQRGLENSARSGNHVTTECSGLYTVGALFPEFRKAEKWRRIALDRESVEIGRMVLPDGFESELTPGYHYGAIHGFLGVYDLAKLNHLPIPPNFKEKLLSMYRALVLVMDPSGNTVPTNDSWGTVNARVIAKEGLKLVGDDPLLAWAASDGKEGTPPPTSTMLPYAGFYAMRGGWQPNDLFLFFRAGPIGTSHQHQEKLEVVLAAWGRTILFDPGAYQYDSSDWRRFTLGTASHNTIIVDGKWQYEDEGWAGSHQITEPVHNPWATTPIFDYVSGTYDAGYRQNEFGVPKGKSWNSWVGPFDKTVTHTRRVLFLKPDYALILDTLDGTGHHTFDAHFNMDAPGATVDPATQAVFSKSEDNIHIALYPLDRDNLAVDVVQGQKDPLLGWFPMQHRAIPTARFRKVQDAPAIFATFLYPYRGDAPTFAATPLAIAGDGLWATTLQTSSEHAEVVMAKDNVSHKIDFHSEWAGNVKAQAALLILRKPVAGNTLCFGGRNVGAYQDQTLAFSSLSPLSLAWIEDHGRFLFFNAENDARTITFTAPFVQEVSLPPGEWREVSQEGTVPATAPEPFAPLPP
ncbi:MAG: heparinase II/III family protein [Methylacidiphilales bacterium]|nr:heparinase II/III family protein [Candidatus Methylacidiphilales bacterium]